MLKKNVLRRKSDFTSIYKEGEVCRRQICGRILQEKRPSLQEAGLFSQQKVGNSVKRNRARRLMKESYRLTDLTLPVRVRFYFHCQKYDYRRKVRRSKEIFRICHKENRG